MTEKTEIKRELLNKVVKKLKLRIKEVQQETKDAYSQEDVWIKRAVERELIDWKIGLERWRKQLQYDN